MNTIFGFGFLLLAQALFNGNDLAGWVPEGPTPGFSAENGELMISGRGNVPHWIRTEREYEDFRLRFEYRVARWAEGAVVMRAPREGRPARAGIALYLGHDFHDKITGYTTGGIPGALPPQSTLKPGFDTWHKADVLLQGDRLRATIDGIVVQNVDLAAHPELRYRLKRGYIGFADLGYAYRLRNLEIEDLGSRHRFVSLFDGSLRGWDLRGAGNWSARDGAIVGSNGHGILYAPGEFGDFELTAMVRSRGRANGGVFLRGFPTGRERGFEIQIYSPVDSVYPSGSIYDIERADVTIDFEDRWFLMQVLVEGAHCLVRLDGQTVAETRALPERWRGSGRVGLQIHKEDSAIEFRDLRVRPLGPQRASSSGISK